MRNMWNALRAITSGRHWHTTVVLFTACGLGSNLYAASGEAFPTIPVNAIDKYAVSYFEEPLESMVMTRIRLKGSKDIIIDVIPSHRWSSQPDTVSAHFHIPMAPDFKMHLISFPKKAFVHQLTVGALTEYLEGVLLRLADTKIEVLEYPETSTGPAKFRIFGERALTICYAMDLNEQRITRSENWVEFDDMIHVITVECPSRSFTRYYKEARGYWNSMSYFEDE